MATVYSDWATASYPFGATATRCRLTVSDVQLTSAENARVDISGAMQSKDGAALDGWGVRVTLGHWETAAGKPTGTKAATGVLRKTAWVAAVSDYWNFERTHSAYQVALFSEYVGQEVDGYAGIKQSGHVEYKVTIPAKPSYAVKFSANGGQGAPAAQTKWHGEALKLSASKPTRGNHTFTGWATSSNAAAAKYQPGGSYTANAAVTLYAVWRINPPKAPTACSVKRVDDNRNDVSWTLADGSAALNAAVLIERSIDGGAWSQAASVAGSATSWSDTATAANHAYRYRVRASNAGGKSGYATSGTVYNTPAAPVSVTASRTGEASVALSIDNPANTATALQYEYAATTAGGGTVATVEGSRVTSATANPGGGTWYFRARNTRGGLVSAWSPWSDPVVTMCPPAAPTPTTPASGAVVSKEQPLMAFSWLHNAPDGSSQTAAELRWRTVGGSWATVTATDAQSADIDLSAVPANASVEWQVRTKGAHASWSPWSALSRFTVAAPPQAAFTAPPSDGWALAVMPFEVALSYSDDGWALASCTVAASDAQGAVAWSRDFGVGTSHAVEASEWLPENGETYTLTASVRSTSGLTASAVRTFRVAFIEPQAAAPVLAPDPETGTMGVTVQLAEDAEAAPAVSIDLWRVNPDGSKVLLGAGLSEGAYVSDVFAPLNAAYRYEAATFAESGAAHVERVTAIIRTPRAFFIGSGATAWAQWEPTLSRSYSRPRRKLVHYEGRRDPVAYDGVQQTVKLSYGAKVAAGQLPAFRALMDEGACVFKSHDGQVVRCVCDVAIGRAPLVMGGACDVSVSMTALGGDAL